MVGGVDGQAEWKAAKTHMRIWFGVVITPKSAHKWTSYATLQGQRDIHR